MELQIQLFRHVPALRHIITNPHSSVLAMAARSARSMISQLSLSASEGRSASHHSRSHHYSKIPSSPSPSSQSLSSRRFSKQSSTLSSKCSSFKPPSSPLSATNLRSTTNLRSKTYLRSKANLRSRTNQRSNTNLRSKTNTNLRNSLSLHPQPSDRFPHSAHSGLLRPLSRHPSPFSQRTLFPPEWDSSLSDTDNGEDDDFFSPTSCFAQSLVREKRRQEALDKYEQALRQRQDKTRKQVVHKSLSLSPLFYHSICNFSLSAFVHQNHAIFAFTH